ncbi:hypothetical protein N7468_007393 [Penicillium chermesinum]|uniref:DUF7719 domain-containing protein n=1 Tax=Penicillium chermesinum TaxID=63820 RepID=A0A9W9NUC5_9EURO|nr:uncharacterized protein N7468_007393 [Penicillium chermesinum]KAJ5226168.1 hypothetical protein N7468_007393 [Penicillium chermesinum]KAJ6160647.1 hypothetical protein N7470_004043 [Penicillium chermesinum]
MDTPPRNRKQRRAAATKSPSDDLQIPLAHPPRDDPSTKSNEHKTFYEMIAERQNELIQQADSMNAARSTKSKGKGVPLSSSGTRFVTVDASGAVVETDGDIDLDGRKPHAAPTGKPFTPEVTEKDDTAAQEPLPPFIDTALLSIPLTTLHLTLAYLAQHQYADSTDVPRLIKEAVMLTLPMLTFLIHFAHGHIVSFRLPASWASLAPEPVDLFPLTQDKLKISFLWRMLFPPSIRSIIFLPLALILGLHLITITNDHPYYGVMRKAPAYGTIWIWSILEMPFGSALLGALGPLIWGGLVDGLRHHLGVMTSTGSALQYVLMDSCKLSDEV